MADTLEKRVTDLEQMLAHIPEDLDARFAGVDVKLAAIREVLALHTTRFTKLEARFSDLDRKVDRLEARFSDLDRKVDRLETRLTDLDRKVDKVDGKLDEVLLRLRKAP
jgi:chromosome segregation ATPase